MTSLTILLAGIAVALTLANTIVFAGARLTGRHGSLVPFLGGISSCLALLACPMPGAWRWAWLPPLLDPGCSWVAYSFARAAVVRRPGRPDGPVV